MMATLLRKLPLELHQRREGVGLSRGQVALEVGVTHETVRRWELGLQFPDHHHLEMWVACVEAHERARLAELLERHWQREAS